MADYGKELKFGSFITPANHNPDGVVELARTSEKVGLDLVTFQDHPYQPSFLDTWTLLSFVAARTERVRLAPNVLNVPLRNPAIIARSAASLDRLSGGRVELGLGAGAFWDAMVAMGAQRRTPGQSVDALIEAIEIIRSLWDTGDPSRVEIEGEHYAVSGAKRGPAPTHDIEIWLGAYKPRMLRTIGQFADGWLPSLWYMKDVSELADANDRIDDAARAAGREPRAIRRLLNISGRFGQTGDGLLSGPAEHWAEQLVDIALMFGTSTFIIGTDDERDVTIFGEEVAPAVRELVAAERG